jgi:hypothetical protein
MLDDNDEPHDWEIKDEEPPEHLRKKWDREEDSDARAIVCPSCKREIPGGNLTCIFCSGFLEQGPGPVEMPWRPRNTTVLISFLIVGPFALPLVWFNPAYSRRKKIIITVIVLALTYALVAVFTNAVKTIFDYYKQAGIF